MTLIRCGYLLVLAGWCGLLWLTYRTYAGPAPAAPPRSIARGTPAAEKHYVSPRQLVAAGARGGQAITPFAAPSQDGRRIAWQDLIGRRPLVIVFIKKDCPCSVEFEPFFHRLENRYRPAVRFVGIIDGNSDDARRYVAANRVPYLVLADEQGAIIRQFKAENGGYIALVKEDGSVDTLWPGCSAEMMRQLSRRMAVLAGVQERTIDVSGMPAVLTTGCPFAS